MKISIAMCTRNGARFLPEQLASLVVQSRLPGEMVICDDCSTDNTPNILKEFAQKAPFPVHLTFNQHLLGSTQNFAKAISLCKEEIIALADQDDVWLLNKLELFEERFARDADVGVVFCDAELVDEDGQLLGQRLWDRAKFDSALKEKIRSPTAYEIFERRDLVSGMTMAFHSRFKSLVLPIPDNIPLIHDGWIVLMMAHAACFDFIDEPLVKYRQHASQQVGAPLFDTQKRSVVAKATSSHQQRTFRELSRVEPVLARMDSCAEAFKFRGRENLERLRQHFMTRQAVSKSKVQSVPSLFRELFSGRYHRYSNGFSSFARDLLL